MILEIKHLSVTQQNKRIISDINLQLNSQARLFLTGEIGSGKSTLLHTLLGFIPFSGELYWFNQKCQQENDFAPLRGNTLGLLFQQPAYQLFGPTVLDDVAFGALNLGFPPEKAYALAKQQLAELNISHLAQRSVNKLSGGEQTLTALAGVLVMSPKVLLLDEPTNHLDKKTQHHLIDYLLQKELTLIVACHDTQFVQNMATETFEFK